MPSENVEYLRDNGPAPAEELPAPVHSRQRHSGIRTFRFSGPRGPTKHVENLCAIYYLDEHDPEAIVRAFCAEHPDFVDEKQKHAFTRAFGRHGSEWRDAARRVANDLDLEVPHKNTTGSGFDADEVGDCPLCGEEIRRPLPMHLRHDCTEN